MEHDILIEPGGNVRFVYDDELATVFDGEDLRTKRASHVEPLGRIWVADMRPSGGPVLGAFTTRAAALVAERAWLRKEKGL